MGELNEETKKSSPNIINPMKLCSVGIFYQEKKGYNANKKCSNNTYAHEDCTGIIEDRILSLPKLIDEPFPGDRDYLFLHTKVYDETINDYLNPSTTKLTTNFYQHIVYTKYGLQNRRKFSYGTSTNTRKIRDDLKLTFQPWMGNKTIGLTSLIKQNK